MFKLVKDHEVNWPVRVPVAVDGGKFEMHEITARFRILPEDELGKRSVKEALKRVIVRLDGIADEQGNALPSSDELIAQVLERSNAQSALMAAYVDASIGGRAKN